MTHTHTQHALRGSDSSCKAIDAGKAANETWRHSSFIEWGTTHPLPKAQTCFPVDGSTGAPSGTSNSPTGPSRPPV